MSDSIEVKVEYNYTDEVNSNNKEWYNKDAKRVIINVYDRICRFTEPIVSFQGVLTHSQVEHIIALIQDNILLEIDIDNEEFIAFIFGVINNYHHVNHEIDNVSLLGDDVFMKD